MVFYSEVHLVFALDPQRFSKSLKLYRWLGVFFVFFEILASAPFFASMYYLQDTEAAERRNG